MKKTKSNWRKIGIGTALLLLSLSLLIMCSKGPEAPIAPAMTEDSSILSLQHPQIMAVMQVQNRHTTELMKHSEVVGTATGLTDDGQPAILVLTKTLIETAPLAKGLPVKESVSKGMIPSQIEGLPVQIMEVGEIKPLKGPPSSGISHTAIQTPPIQLGTSGGWRYDVANGYCCGGTLGSLVSIGGDLHILSNYHVLEADIVDGGNGLVATKDDPVIQPGLIDVGCVATNAQDVATLVKYISLPGNNVDAAVAKIITGMVDESGAILEIGTISSTTVAADIGQLVKKSGRTTGLTRSAVSGLNGTVSIVYDNECAGGAAFNVTFTGQILITNQASKFLAGGDSGSLMVEDVDTNPRAVGLLFAGSRSIAVANPIDHVLAFLGATMVGN